MGKPYTAFNAAEKAAAQTRAGSGVYTIVVEQGLQIAQKEMESGGSEYRSGSSSSSVFCRSKRE